MNNNTFDAPLTILDLPIDILGRIMELDMYAGYKMRTINVEMKKKVDSLFSTYLLTKPCQSAFVFGTQKRLFIKSRPFESLTSFFERVHTPGNTYDLKIINGGYKHLETVGGERLDFEFDKISFYDFHKELSKKYELVTKSVEYKRCSVTPAIFPRVKNHNKILLEACKIDSDEFFKGLNFRVEFTGFGESGLEPPSVIFNSCKINIQSFGCFVEFGRFRFSCCEFVGNSFESLFELRTMHTLNLVGTNFPRTLPLMRMQFIKIEDFDRYNLEENKIILAANGIDVSNVTFFENHMELNRALRETLSLSTEEEDKTMVENLDDIFNYDGDDLY